MGYLPGTQQPINNTQAIIEGAGDIPQPEAMAHPLIEKYMRMVAAGQMTGEQAHAAIVQELDAAKKPQPGAPAPEQPGPASAPPPQVAIAPPPGPPPGAQSLGAPTMAPGIDASIAGAPPLPPKVTSDPGTPSLGAAPIAPPDPSQQAPSLGKVTPGDGAPVGPPPGAPQANPGNAGAGPSQSAMLGAADNQQMGSVTRSLPTPTKPIVAPRNLVSEAGLGGSAGVAPPAPLTGAAAARAALLSGLNIPNDRPMTVKEVNQLAQIYSMTGRAGIEQAKEYGKQQRAELAQRTKLLIAGAGNDAKMQGLAQQWEVDMGKLGVAQQTEADHVARDINQAQIARERLNELMLRFNTGQVNKFALEEMKQLNAQVVASMRGLSTVSSSLNADSPAGKEYVRQAQEKLAQTTEDFRRFSNHAVTTEYDPSAPALQPKEVSPADGAAGPNQLSPKKTAGEAASDELGKPVALRTGGTKAPASEKTVVAKKEVTSASGKRLPLPEGRTIKAADLKAEQAKGNVKAGDIIVNLAGVRLQVQPDGRTIPVP